VTYNFDPDRWLENERLRLEQRRRAGQLSEEAAARAAEELERRYEAMLARLDGTFQVDRQRTPGQ
jgi:ABC-type phosphate transport system auxiliary subunit